MDYTEFHNNLLFLAPGLKPEMLSKHYSLYFDETNNAKMFHLKDGDRLNVPVGVRFVLGGVCCSKGLTQEEINSKLKLQKTSNELKFDIIYGHGNWDEFVSVLKSQRLTSYLSLLEEKDALLHFSSVNLFYYALVDIIDSLDYDNNYTFALKSILYQVAWQNPEAFVKLFRDNTYPDVKDVDAFMKELVLIVGQVQIANPLGKIVLLDVLTHNIGRKELTFIQDETPNVFIENFLHFYQEPLYKYANSSIVLDNEVNMMEGLMNNPVVVNGKGVDYRFVDSKTEPWIQMSDVAASLVARYLCFVESDSYLQTIDAFTHRQLGNFMRLNRILAASEQENKLFWHFVDDARIADRFSKCVMNFR